MSSDHSVSGSPEAPARGVVAILLPILIGIVLGLGLYTADHAEATSCLSNDPAACLNCHVMREDFDAWAKGAIAAVALVLLIVNIRTRKEEAKEVAFHLVELTEETVDPAEWGKNFPRQHDCYERTVDVERTKHGGSEAFQHLEEDPA